MRALNQSEKPLVSDFGAKEQRLLFLCSQSHSNRESGTNEELVQLWPGGNQRTTITVADNRLAERTAQSHTEQGTENFIQAAKRNGMSLWAFRQDKRRPSKKNKKKNKTSIFFQNKKPERMTVVNCRIAELLS